VPACVAHDLADRFLDVDHRDYHVFLGGYAPPGWFQGQEQGRASFATGRFDRDGIPSTRRIGVRLLFDDDLVEGVVQLCATGKRAGIRRCKCRFHAERERCYQVLDPDDRATAFARACI
jgi:hypothetical protein